MEGVRRFHELVSPFIEEPDEVLIGIETDRGLFVGALLAAGYRVLAINPFSASRYRERSTTSGAKSDPGDAAVLADIVRTDAHQHRPVAGDSELAEAIKILARAHQSMIWTRSRQINAMRSTLLEYYPNALLAFGERLGSAESMEVLMLAPTPEQGAGLSRSKIASALKRGGRQRRIEPGPKRSKPPFEPKHSGAASCGCRLRTKRGGHGAHRERAQPSDRLARSGDHRNV